jgi:dTDP-4-amino-4,6-dideoxygalactose transaminase
MERVLSLGSLAMVPVHHYGLPADMDHLLDLAETYDVAVVEDAAQAHGAEYRGRPVGAIGDAGCFSFYPTKNMTTGEGGMIVTDRDDVASRARRFINHGRADGDGLGYDHVEVGHNFRMTSIAAAIGRAQLDRLPGFIQTRRSHAAMLSEAIEGLPGIEVPFEPDDRRHAFHQYTIRCADREGIGARLTAAGIGNGVYYPTPIHRQPAYADVEREFPVAERASREVLSLPVHPALTDDDIRTVAETVRERAVVDGRAADD